MGRQETVIEKRVVEALTTAILNNDPAAQAVAATGLSEGEERFARAGASILAGVFVALATSITRAGHPISPQDTWAKHLSATIASREAGGRG